jgi:hypothetical protein
MEDPRLRIEVVTACTVLLGQAYCVTVHGPIVPIPVYDNHPAFCIVDVHFDNIEGISVVVALLKE